MRGKLVFLLAIAVVLCSSSAQAIPFTSSYYGDTNTSTYITIDDSPTPTLPFTLTTTFNPPADEVNSATLHINYKGTDGEFSHWYDAGAELWAVEGSGGSWVSLGNLQAASDWTTQDFILPSSLYSGVSGNTWTFQVRFTESTEDWTWADDTFKLNYAYLSGDYDAQGQGNPVPEPCSMLLLGSGLVGIAAFRRKIKK